MGQGRPRVNKCDGCRSRHLKCDLLRPTCTPCLQHGFTCEYSVDAVFVPYRPKEKKEKQKNSLQTADHAWPYDDTPKTPAPRRSTALAPTSVTIMGEPVWFAHLFAAISSDKDSVLGTWIGFRAASYDSDSLARESFTALACSFFGRSNNSSALLQWGHSQYLHCLRKIHLQLDHGPTCASSQSLLTVAILGYYESLLLTAPSAWVKHYTGLAQMMRLAGPEACKDGVVFDILRQNRFMMILAAMATQSDTFLSRPEWRSVPWDVQNVPKDAMHELLDIVADLPLLKSGRGPESAATARTILRRLDDWRRTWNDSIESDLVLSDSSDLEYPPAWLDPITASSLLTMNCFCIYNAAVIMASDHALRTSEAKDLQPGDASTLFHKRYEAAVGICRALDYHFAPNSGSNGGLFILWPLRMAVKVLKDGTLGERMWLERRTGQAMHGEGMWDIRHEVLREFQGV